MDSDIAYFILNKIYMRKEEFIINMCQRYYNHLFEYLDIYSTIYKSRNDFSFIEEDWDFNFVKNNFNGLHLAIEGKDYEIILYDMEFEKDGKIEIKTSEVKNYTKKFIEDNMSYKCKNSIEEINYIRYKYKEYIDEFKYINM